ncbi:TetR/AcrR family transcriptional regulator [Actinomadura macrotermitis]|uniref:HTH tetR-type domain-containing protein n=1 Tax=Actinomadura macrotermitis TaxID=2585200 RepID=A0A7K0BUA1_9ACTN|nr:TetR/AcrR family transcriptional regulator [Actinomadura macrotermitis]MQY04775.1 hypothetical protein [Actinomadura macrotermitis]
MTGAQTGRRRFRRLPSGRRREEIISAAAAMFGARPEHEVTIDDVAAAAGTSRSSVYRFFDGRQELYGAVARRVGDELLERMHRVTDGPPSLLLRARLGIYFDFVAENAGGWGGVLGSGAAHAAEAAQTVLQEVRDRACALTLATLGAEEASPVLRGTVQAWITGVEWASAEWARTGRPERAELERLLAAHLAGMLVGAAALDPGAAERLAWLAHQEPADSSFGTLVRLIGHRVGGRELTNLARFLGHG